MIRSAILSPCGRYRVRLERVWRPERPRWLWLMLNPSTADGERDDATVRRLIGFTERAGGGGFLLENLYSLRSTSPAALWAVPESEAVGPDCDSSIAASLAECDGPVVLAPGAVPQCGADRFWSVVAMVRQTGREPLCLGLTRSGRPVHPVRLPYALEFVPLNQAMDAYHASQAS